MCVFYYFNNYNKPIGSLINIICCMCHHDMTKTYYRVNKLLLLVTKNSNNYYNYYTVPIYILYYMTTNKYNFI